MKRRALLTSLGVLGVTAGSGCLSTLTATGQATTSAATSQKSTEGLSATVTNVSYDGTSGANEESVSLSVDCSTHTATLTGWFSTSSCRTIAIQALRYDSTEADAELVLFPRWAESASPDTVDCAGASYQYQVELQAQERLPNEIRVVYDRPDDRPSTRFTARSETCS